MAIAVGRTQAPGPASAYAGEEFEHEELVVRRGSRSDVPSIVAVHSTALGPALGGVRIWTYPGAEAGVRDALRLAEGMTFKAAAAGLELGGGKGVICAPAGGLDGELRRAALLDFGDLVDSLGGRYITAEDVGASPADLATIAERTSHVTGLPPERGGTGDPSPFTAIGVEAAIRACVAARFGSRELAGRRICVIGLGHVGASLARRLAAAGCELAVSDIAADKRELAGELGARWLDPDHAHLVECDVLAPCALGGIVTDENVDLLACEVVCGSANNQLAHRRLADGLAERGILYAPDFIANAGGLINVYREIKGYSEARAIALAKGIEETMSRLFEDSRELGITPLAAAHGLARERLGDAALRD